MTVAIYALTSGHCVSLEPSGVIRNFDCGPPALPPFPLRNGASLARTTSLARAGLFLLDGMELTGTPAFPDKPAEEPGGIRAELTGSRGAKHRAPLSTAWWNRLEGYLPRAAAMAPARLEVWWTSSRWSGTRSGPAWTRSGSGFRRGFLCAAANTCGSGTASSTCGFNSGGDSAAPAHAFRTGGDPVHQLVGFPRLLGEFKRIVERAARRAAFVDQAVAVDPDDLE